MSITLHIGQEQTTVTSDASTLVLDLGSTRTAHAFFRHTPPTLGELENAIMAVEDEVTRARSLVAGDPTLETTGMAIREIALLAGVRDQPVMELSIEAVERMFDLLAALVQGRPASSAGLPNTREFAATLLILREFMHHLQFAAIRIADTDA
ncbi:hypothetical protein [Rhodoferax saidenbachensis]|uniref:Ppx/GppA phosphatase domain-containing protein n=1 Tax=Rhodoferax saidenbachensis TaxID=1484693 RepID=A0A1P8K5G0_9BURK|nr:hypothetical protein [Rhodoferax saidenbachensis]APW41237.1 hypothetical protein RS694_00875 [Rhodoferax saidenbachensis]